MSETELFAFIAGWGLGGFIFFLLGKFCGRSDGRGEVIKRLNGRL